jgi:phosphonopyruvate decarboxylase
MIQANQFLEECLSLGFDFFTGTPCSYLKPFINYVIDHNEFRFIDAVNEGDAVAIAAGVTVAGGRSVVMFQNSGLGNAVNPLTSLIDTFHIPIMLIVTLRGEPGGHPDEPQHELMGAVLTDLLDAMRIKWSFFPNESNLIKSALHEANNYMLSENKPFVFVMKKDDVNPYELQFKREDKPFHLELKQNDNFSKLYVERHTRTEALKVIQTSAGKNSVLIATTGKTGRELYELDDKENQIYLVGSMGCALAFGFGIAVTKPDLNVYVIDGDGALLMRTGTMATVGAYQPENLTHVLLDNEAHDSTGGQSTVSNNVSFSAVAKGFGYKNAVSTDQLKSFETFLHDEQLKIGPTFIHFKIKKGSPKTLGRPGIKPYEVKERLQKFIQTRERK